jgi:hypothetical protein
VTIEDLLGKRTLWTVSAPDLGQSYIVQLDKRRNRLGLDESIILAEGPNLSTMQLQSVKSIVLNPESYYLGIPVFRRFPHHPNFALRLTREGTILDLMIDLHNPGWDFCCGGEFYSSWHWADFRGLAKALFPELASRTSGSMWKQGVISRLKAAKGINQV